MTGEPDLFAHEPDPPAPKVKKAEVPRCPDCGRRQSCEERGDAKCVEMTAFRRHHAARLQKMIHEAMSES